MLSSSASPKATAAQRPALDHGPSSRDRLTFRRLARSLTIAAAAAAALAVMVAPQASAAQRTKVLPGFNGSVNAISEPDSNGISYVGGLFTAYNAFDTGYAAVVDSTSNVIQTQFPKVSGGNVNAAAADGSGGWYIGGDFTTVDGVTRNRAAHINSDGSLDSSWNPNLNNSVTAIAVSGSTVYLGGAFTTVGGTTRNYAAAVGTDGTLQNWNPNLNNSVTAMAVSGSNVYLGGSFTTVGGTTRNRAAAVSISATGNGSGGSCLTAYASGCLGAWDPNMSAIVRALAVSGSNVYLGGDFTTVGGTTRNYAAAVGTDGTLQNWNPNLNGSLYALAVSGSTVYLGGGFTTVGGTARRYAAAVAISATGNGSGGSCLTAYASGCLGAWDPNMSSTVNALAISGSTVYLGGAFGTVGGTTRNRAAAVATDGTLQDWHPNLNGTTNALAAAGSNVYLGGRFTTAGGQIRNGAAAFNADGTLSTTWNPNVSGTVSALAVSGSTVYLGGSFTTVGGTTRNRAAAVGTDGTLQSWDPNITNGTTGVTALAVSGSTVYLGGDFTFMGTGGSTTRNRAAAVSISDTGNGSAGSCLTAYTSSCVTAWNPNVTASSTGVTALAVSGSTVYLGGLFSAVGGSTRTNAAAVGTGGTVTSWSPTANGQVRALAVSGSTVYLGGAFGTVGGTTRNRAAALGTDGTLQDWNPNMGGVVGSLAVSGSTVYLGGSFTTVGGTTRNRAAAVSTSDTGNGSGGSCLTAYASACLAAWDPNMGSNVNALATSGSTVYLGGIFTTVGGTTRTRVAAVGTDGTLGSWGTGMPSPTLDTSAATISRGTTVKGDAATPAGGPPGSYKWQRCTSSSAVDCSDISGAGSTGAWWGSRNADIGNRVRLKAVWDTLDSTITGFSTITGVFIPTATTAPTIDQGLVSGAPKVGTSIHSSFGVWSGYRAGLTTVTFQWQRCTTNDSSSCATNVGTNSQWYKPVSADQGKYLRVTATLTTNGQTATASSSLSGPVAAARLGRKAKPAAKKARATARARKAL